jgi:hypothetical protein
MKLSENTTSEFKKEESSEKFKEIMDSILQDDEEVEYPEYDDVPSSF